MARGRMLNKSVSLSLKFDRLPDDTCRLLATWTLAHLDVRGVFYADPVVVKSLVFPRRTDISVERIESYMQAMEEAGLIVCFSAEGEIWQHWPGFEHNQIGLRADRETTCFPAPPRDANDDWSFYDREPEAIPPLAGNLPDDCRKDDGKMPDDRGEKSAEEEVEVKGEVKVKEKQNLAPDGASKPGNSKINKNELKAKLAAFFAELCRLPQPKCASKRAAKSANIRWFEPLLEIAASCDNDLERAESLIHWSVKKMDDQDLAVSAPQSILKVAVAEQARRKREQSKSEVYLGEREEEARRNELAYQTWEQEKADVQAEIEADPGLATSREIWREACVQLKSNLGKETFSTWIAPLRVASSENGTKHLFTLIAPNERVLEWIECRMRNKIEQAAGAVVGEPVRVELKMEETNE